jgi:4-amino-4-deoxy-L-arabinose transferase-like glycosyltransferase
MHLPLTDIPYVTSIAARAPVYREAGFWLVILVAACARCIGLYAHATIPDEAFTFFIAAHPVPMLLHLLRVGDFHPPLSYLIGHLLLELTSRAYLLRTVSAAFGVAGVAATYCLARRILGGSAVLAGLLVALNPVLVFLDGFFRMYAMLWALAVLSWLALVRAFDEPRRAGRWVLYAALTAALLYTQYLAFFIIAAQALWVVLCKRRTPPFWVAWTASVLSFAPWAPVFAAQYALGGSAFNFLRGHLDSLLTLPAVLLADGLPAHLEYAPLLVTFLWLLLAAGLTSAAATRNWLLVALNAPLVLQIAYSFVSGKLLIGQRYFVQVIPGLVLLALAGIAELARLRTRPLAPAAACVLVVLAAAGTADKHFLSSYMPVDWTRYGAFLDGRMRPGDAIIFDSGMVYYVLVGTKAVTGRPVFAVSNARQARADAAFAARYPRVWLVSYQTFECDPQLAAFRELARTHPHHLTWQTTAANYGDVVFTTLFWRDAARTARRGP